jgi:hypothetical protein
MKSGTMLRALLSGLVLAMATSQQSDATFTPLPNPSPRCCDGTTAECQALIRQCFANTNSTASGTTSCYSIACPTPMPVPSSPISPPSSQCCDPATLPCQDAIKACIGVGNTQSFCYQSLVCPTPSPLSRSPFPTIFPPSPIQCCDPTRMQCTADQVICPSVTQTLKPQQSPSASFTLRPVSSASVTLRPVASESVTTRPPPPPSPMETFTPFPTTRPVDQPTPSSSPKPCCDPSTQSCQDAIKECLAQGLSPATCQTLACSNTTAPTYLPSAPCCDPAKPECMETVKRCFDSGNPPSMCQALMCPTPIPSIPSDMPQCCDPAKPECLFAIRQCITQGGTDLLCNMLACPTITPQPIKPSVSAFPSRRPPVPSRSAFPTMMIKPLFSALPTRPPARTRLPINFTLPDRLPAVISFPRANVTELIRPAKLQEIQASIACAVRMPLENIEIKNITIRRALTGLEEPVNVDLSVARLRSNGSVQCMVVRTSAPAQRRLRRLQQEDTVNVQYDIVAPTEDAMTTDLDTALTGDATMNAIASSVGGTSVVATTGQTQQQQQPQQQTTPSSNINTIGIIIGSVGGLIAVIALSALVVQTQRNRRSTVSATTRASHAPSVIVVTQENPISHPANATQSQRVVFTPYGARV